MQGLEKWTESFQFAQSQSQVVSTQVHRKFTDPVLCAGQFVREPPTVVRGSQLCAGLLTPHWL